MESINKNGIKAMDHLFSIVGTEFFSPLTSVNKTIYLDCLNIIYDTYRSELSYGVDREVVMQKLMYYFDDLNVSDIQEDDGTTLNDSQSKASAFLRQLKRCHWVETEIGSDQRVKITMPGYAVTMIQTFERIAGKQETEYQSKIATIYSTLTNPELLREPYAFVVKPVFELTVDLFTALKQLNTGIKHYIENLTSDKSAEDIIKNYLKYSEEIGSQAYHRLMTSDNVSRFRIMILSKLDDIRSDTELFQKVVWGYQKTENEADYETAKDNVRKMVNDIIDYFHSYDDIVKEVTSKHTKYLNQTVKRAKFLLSNTNNVEGKINTILRYLSEECNRDEENNIDADAPDEICMLFSIFPQGFLSEESIMTMPISRKITDVDQVADSDEISEEERRAAQERIYEKYRNRFSKKNINLFVATLLKDKDTVKASEISAETKRDMIRIVFISLYGQSSRSEYSVRTTGKTINRLGFEFRDFEIRRKKK